MAESNQYDTDGGGGKSKTKDGNGEKVEYPRRQSDGNNGAAAASNNDDGSDNECWDDAEALINNNDDDDDDDDGDACDIFRDAPDRGVKSINNSNKANTNRRKQTLTSPADTVDGPVTSKWPASSSSAYSSVQSNRATSVAAAPGSRLSAATSSNSDASNPSQASNDLILHEAIFNNDAGKILTILDDAQLVRSNDLVNKRDKHGNTALHLACAMGCSPEIINALLHNKHGLRWSIDVKNLNRWTPFHEACSYGNREVITLMAKQLRDDVDDVLRNHKLANLLEKTRDYRIVLKWEFQSWVPLISRVLPSDLCEIIKQGKRIRVNTRLFGFDGLFGKTDCCLVYSGLKWILMDNKARKYGYIEMPDVDKDIDKKVDDFMATDIMDMELKSSEMQLTRSKSGWIWKADKVGKVGRFNAALYDLDNVFLVTKKRREHLSEHDTKRNKILIKSAVNLLKFGEKTNSHQLRAPVAHEGSNQTECEADESQMDGDDGGEDDDDVNGHEIIHRSSLPAPPRTRLSWQDYLRSEPGKHPALGREQKCKQSKMAVKASVAMSEDFPLSKRELLDLLSIVPIKLFKKLQDFVEMKLPDGFPVRLDIPVHPFLMARITFEDFAFLESPLDESLFRVPEDYELSENLLRRFRNNGSSNCDETASALNDLDISI